MAHMSIYYTIEVFVCLYTYSYLFIHERFSTSPCISPSLWSNIKKAPLSVECQVLAKDPQRTHIPQGSNRILRRWLNTPNSPQPSSQEVGHEPPGAQGNLTSPTLPPVRNKSFTDFCGVHGLQAAKRPSPPLVGP